MRIGIAIEETWDFLHEIYADLAEHHQVTLFKRRHLNLPVFHTRVNRWLFHYDLHQFMKKNDVVFFEWASDLLLAATTQMPKECGIVTRLHRYEMYKFVDRINWDFVDQIILVSHAKKEEFLAQVPAQASKVTVVNEAVDPQKYEFRPKPFSGDIGTLCHLTPRKRVYELILTFYELCQQHNGFRLHIGGGRHAANGDYYYALHDVVRKLNLTDKVIFYGQVDDAWNWYNNVDIFISNSYSEGLQVAPIEAMACGCYVLSHRWAGADELLPDENCYYSDSELKARILDYCALSEEQKQENIAALRQRVSAQLNIHDTKQVIRQILESLAQRESKSIGASVPA